MEQWKTVCSSIYCNGRALKDIGNDKILAIAVMFTIVILSFTNFTGVSITKYASAMHRVVITAGRPLCIWIVAYCLNWEGFIWLQFVGYFVIVIGILMYYQVITYSLFVRSKKSNEISTNAGTDKQLIDN
eukprot:TRINITY_DN3225_c0_g1_i4.p1 TRINITY_DN3225_c0_g1~~TRINITY_DN3225_c0_g1_i4.p1  ORF type:complete len:130 (+),score=0.03 TRINITY_DN3225_c0_g1_i4:880-1269(+)